MSGKLICEGLPLREIYTWRGRRSFVGLRVNWVSCAIGAELFLTMPEGFGIAVYIGPFAILAGRAALDKVGEQ